MPVLDGVEVAALPRSKRVRVTTLEAGKAATGTTCIAARMNSIAHRKRMLLFLSSKRGKQELRFWTLGKFIQHASQRCECESIAATMSVLASPQQTSLLCGRPQTMAVAETW